MNKNIIAFTLVLALASFVGVANAKDGADDNNPSSSVSQRSNSDVKGSTSDDSDNALEIEAEVFTNETIVKVEIGEVKSIFITTVKTRAEIAAEVLVKYPTLTSAQIEAALKIETEDRASRPSDSVLDKDDDNDGVGDEHKSIVAQSVQKLLSVANRQKGIGPDIKIIAQEQNDSAVTTTTAIEKVESRKGFKAFLIGADYKNIGVIRSELAKSSNQLERLKDLVAKTTNATDKAELEAQIKALEESQVKVNKFVTDNESKFSLFGWFSKLFK